ncbi:hypothetical protein C4D60_Mb02t10500 [Musa balbisiana]|uniref:Uncharacterized protein n=1 Tax=Musa balbisiana TaxID=52838 RepID=A0A4S8I9P9_MUSBA|nr:hypothetical protein C4D60_Mb02t10500 [Musa balbisiana]
MGWASPHDGSEEEAVTAWGRPAPDTTAAILADSIRFASSAVIPIPLLSPSFSWKLRSSRRRRRKQEKEDIFDVVLRRELIMSDMDVDGHLNQNAETDVPSSQQEEEAIKKKYGGILPRKTTGHIQADWALGKVSLSAHTKLFRAKTP